MRRSSLRRRRQTLLSWLAVVLIVLLQVQLLPTMSVEDSDVIANGSGVIASSAKQSQDQAVVQANYGKLPLAFEPNQGQVDGAASFLVHHGQATTYFDGANTTTTVGDTQVTMSLDGANKPNFIGTDQLESKTNYFIGNDQSKWHSDVPNYKNLLAKNVYPGIDLKYYGNNSQLEHDFIVSPNADYHQITFHFTGQDNLTPDDNGNLILKTTNDKDTATLNAPITYQQTKNTKHTIPSKFNLDENNTVTISLNGDYDKSQPLIIDPTLTLVYSTYLGGTGGEYASGVAVDSSGSAYVTGYVDSTNFPTASPFQGTKGAGTDAFVTKFNAAGSTLTYSTYLGGNGGDTPSGVAVDTTGNAYILGRTGSTDFPTASPFQAANAGGIDAFVTKLNAAGSALAYSTYLGGSSCDECQDVGVDVNDGGIAIDASGNAYITGQTQSTNFPTASPFQAANGGNGDAFVTKFNAAGSALTFSTYLGGSGYEYASGIAVDTSGDAYIDGQTDSSNFPTSLAFQASNAGGLDAFVTKFNAAGSALVYSTYLGGVGTEIAEGVGVDSSGSAYVTGYVDSTNFPTASPLQATNGGSGDAFVTKFNTAGSALTYSTYLGGSGYELASGIAVDASGNAYLSGFTNSTDFPTASPFQASNNNGGGSNSFVTQLNAAGSALTYSTYLGGSGYDLAYAVAVDSNSDAYIVGSAGSANFPTASPFQAANAGSGDAFITKITNSSAVSLTGDPVNLTAQVNPTLTFTVDSTSCALGALSNSQTQSCTYAMTAATNGTTGYTISYLPVTTLTSGANTITALSSLTASALNTEQFGINLRANTAVGSHTVGAFGADVSGGSGVVASAYNTPNSFKLVAAGDTVSSAPSPSLTSTYTVSTIANIDATTEAGAYTTTLTYNIVAGY